jgi:hypothetical protein
VILWPKLLSDKSRIVREGGSLSIGLLKCFPKLIEVRGAGTQSTGSLNSSPKESERSNGGRCSTFRLNASPNWRCVMAEGRWSALLF